MFSGLLEMESDYLDLSRVSSQLGFSLSVCWKDNTTQFSSPSPPTALLVVQELDKDAESKEEF